MAESVAATAQHPFTPGHNQEQDHHNLPPYLSNPSRSSTINPSTLSPDAADLLLKPFLPGQPKSLSGIALRAFCLGTTFSASLAATLAVLIYTHSPIWRVPFFLFALSLFHFLEFWTTAEKNTLVASIDSFLLTANWPSYAIAHSAAFAECAVVSTFFPRRNWTPIKGGANILLVVGFVLVLIGQVARSAAMLHAGASFNHHIQTRKAQTHILVTTGIYSWIRHPSYFGFFYWGLGTQLVLGNVVCFFVYLAVLWFFFSQRIKVEEEKLVEFFQEDYVRYRKRVGTLIPFIR